MRSVLLFLLASLLVGCFSEEVDLLAQGLFVNHQKSLISSRFSHL